MPRDELQRASELLREASVDAEDAEVQQRLYDQSDQLARLATGEEGPDHGRLARHMNALHELAGEVEDAQPDLAETVREAREAVSAYRETVEGV